jgi:hypothetical protein
MTKRRVLRIEGTWLGLEGSDPADEGSIPGIVTTRVIYDVSRSTFEAIIL